MKPHDTYKPELNRERLLKARKHAGLTQDEVGAALNISRSYLSEIERGLKKGPFELIAQLAQLYNVSLDFLCGLAPSSEGEVMEYRVHDIEERRLLDIWRRMDKSERLDFMSSLAVYLSSDRSSASVSHVSLLTEKRQKSGF
ncbi:helix-turn-helix transcriptional regulator [Acetobacteraceae bacterium ESL0709]|nr:helix-turn-helix transcriptional regulator [Acetobacteraceae bacterium ESL0697]MDF7677414.1 helix-turn-helix transcriptional regulator [Acetobacteraceae bacterium ESL0709]